MGYYKVYKNTKEFKIVESESPVKAQWLCDFIPFRVVECNEDGSKKIPNGYKEIKKSK